MTDHDGGRAAARRARVAAIAQVTGGASIPHDAGDGITPELTEAETLEVAAMILEPGERIRETHREPVKARPPRMPGEPIPETDEPINQFRERAARYKRDA